MALTECDECGAAVSDRARSCPQCGGRPTPARKPTPAARLGLAVVALAAIAWFIGYLVRPDPVDLPALARDTAARVYPAATPAELSEISRFCAGASSATVNYVVECAAQRAAGQQRQRRR